MYCTGLGLCALLGRVMVLNKNSRDSVNIVLTTTPVATLNTTLTVICFLEVLRFLTSLRVTHSLFRSNSFGVRGHICSYSTFLYITLDSTLDITVHLANHCNN